MVSSLVSDRGTEDRVPGGRNVEELSEEAASGHPPSSAIMDPFMAGQDELEDLARKGRDEIAKREARELRRKERREQLKRAKIQLIAECSTTPLGGLCTGEPSMLGPLLIVGVASFLV